MDLIGAFIPLFVMIGVLTLALILVRRARKERERLKAETTPSAVRPAATPSEGPSAAVSTPEILAGPAGGGAISGLPVEIRPEELPLSPDDPRLKILAQHLTREELAQAGFPVPPEDLFKPDDRES